MLYVTEISYLFFCVDIHFFNIFNNFLFTNFTKRSLDKSLSVTGFLVRGNVLCIILILFIKQMIHLS